MKTGYRTIRILVGDTLQQIAMRELNDAARWPELITLNSLRPPYIVATRALAGLVPGTLAYGDKLKVPAVNQRSGVADEDLFGRDVALEAGRLSFAAGDLATVIGLGNLRQALRHRLITEPGELLFHADYGCMVHSVLGERSTPAFALFAAGLAARAIRAEPRVASVAGVSVSDSGDTLQIAATVTPVSDNTPFDLNLVFPVEA